MKVSALRNNAKGGFTLIELMVVIAILAALASIGYGPILDHMNDGQRQKAQSNLQSLGTILRQFKTDYGTYPCDSTATTLQDSNPDLNFGSLTGNTSNDYFRQVFYSKGNSSEKPFFAQISCAGKTIAAEGDEKLANGSALAKGENAMAYVMSSKTDDEGGKKAIPGNKSNVPLAFCGIYPSNTPYPGTSVEFDISSFRGHVFMLSADGSVKDLEKSLDEDDNDDEKGRLKPDASIFPETKKGRATAEDYIVLSPDL